MEVGVVSAEVLVSVSSGVLVGVADVSDAADAVGAEETVAAASLVLREVALILLADMINKGLNVNWVDAGLSDWDCQRVDCSESKGLMQVPGETWSRRKLGTRRGRAKVCSASRRGGCAAEKGAIDAAGKGTAGCGGTREMGVKQWPATQDGRRASRFGLGG